MNHGLPPPSTTLRGVGAVVAVLMALLMVRSIDGLLDHYSGAALHAAARTTQLAKAPDQASLP
jgi:hypothetical protein